MRLASDDRMLDIGEFEFSSDRQGQRFPERPEVSLSLLFALVLWVSTALVLVQARTWDMLTCIAVCCLCAVCSAVCAFLAAFKYEGVCRIALVCAIGTLIGCSCGSIQVCTLHSQHEDVRQRHAYEHTLRVVSDPVSGEFGQSCYAKNVDGAGELVRVNLPADSDVLTWDAIHVFGTVKDPKAQAEESFWKKGCIGSINAREVVVLDRHGITGVVTDARISAMHLFDEATCDSDRESQSDDLDSGAALMKAIVCGWRSDLFKMETYEDVKAVGLTHLVAVSGSHLVLTAGFFATVLQCLGLSKRFVVIAQAVFIGLFIVFTGAPISVLRASAMAMCALMSFFAQRRPARAHALGICASVMIVVNPQNALSISFALSAAATAGIVLFARYMSSWVLQMQHGHGRAVADIVGMTCAATFFTIPISASEFSQFPLIAPVSNLVAAPFFTVLCSGGLVAVLMDGIAAGISCGVSSFAAVASLTDAMRAMSLHVAGIMCVIAEAFARIVERVSMVPYACVPVSISLPVGIALVFVTSVVLLMWWPLPSRKRVRFVASSATLALVVFLFVVPWFNPQRIVALDVGQGDAILLQDGGHAVLIDTGKPRSGVVAGLARHHVRCLDAVVLTHHDDDHYGAVSEVIRTVRTKRVFVAQDAMSCSCNGCEAMMKSASRANVSGLSAGDSFNVGRMRCSVVAPQRFCEEGGNQDSLIVLVRAPRAQATWTALLVGDAEDKTIAELLANGSVGKVDIYKVGHHGSRVAIDDEVARSLDPSISLISVGGGNRYGHPNQECIERLLRTGSRVGRTDEHGDISCVLEDTRIRVQFQR